MTNVWFITGSARGLGRSMTEKALTEGARVVATARHTDSLADLVAKYGDQIYPMALDVTDEAAVTSAVNEAHDHFGGLDVLVNNAGFADMDSVEEMDMDSFKHQMDTDYYGTLYAIRAALPFMRVQKSGHIINISSVGGRAGTAGLGAYQSAKFAVDGLTEVVALETKPFNIQVTAVEPGGMRTDWGGKSMKAASSDLYKESVGQMINMIHDNWGGDADGMMPISDPSKVADAVYTLSEMNPAPQHLLLGKDAAFGAKKHADELAASDEANRELTESTTETN